MHFHLPFLASKEAKVALDWCRTVVAAVLEALLIGDGAGKNKWIGSRRDPYPHSWTHLGKPMPGVEWHMFQL